MKSTDILFKLIENEIEATHAEFIGPRRSAYLIEGREAFARICRDELKYSLPRIAHLLGDRDHTTIINLLIKKRMHDIDYQDIRRRFLHLTNAK